MKIPLVSNLSKLFRKDFSTNDSVSRLKEYKPEMATSTEIEEPSPLIKEQRKNANVLNPQPPAALGIKRKFTLGIGFVVITIFVVSFVYSLEDSSPKKKVAQPQGSVPSSQTETMSKVPDSYSALDRYNRNPQQQNNMTQQGTMQGNGYPQGVQAQYTQGSGQQRYYYSQIPSNGGYNGSSNSYNNNGFSNGYMPPKMPQQPNAEEPRAQENKGFLSSIPDFIKSPIQFVINGGGSQNSSSTASASSMQSIQNNTSYQSQQPSFNQLSPYGLQAGTIIPCTMITGIDSDLSAQPVAQVRQNVYDSLTGDYLLIPQGSRLVGDYTGGKVGQGQQRINVVWKEIYLPNGMCVQLSDMPSVDNGGYPGLTERVNNHEGRLLGAIAMSSILSATAQIAAGNTNSGNNQSASQLAISGAAANIMTAGGKIIDRDLNIGPTILISPGHPFNILVNKDIILRPYE